MMDRHGQISKVPAGNYAVGCSGGPDSVALLLLAHQWPGVTVHAVHLNHQTRGDESTGDATFVAALAQRLGVPCTVELLENVAAGMGPERPANASALYRAARLALFRRVCEENRLAGVLLAHHADDQAETCLQRLLRGSGPAGLGGMGLRSEVGGIVLWRPLLKVGRAALREYLTEQRQGFRVDASNASNAYFRNRLRKLLAGRPGVSEACVELAGAMGTLRDWVRGNAQVLGEQFRVEELNELPVALARESARQWLVGRGVPAGEVEPAVIDRLLRMAGDAASPAVVEFPGGVRGRRKGGAIYGGKAG